MTARAMQNDEPLIGIAMAIADGRRIDWSSIPHDVADSPGCSPALVERLQALERVVRGHEAMRTDSPVVDDARDTILTEASRKGERQNRPVEVHWGPLVVIEKIGRGSFGDVYRAWDPRLDREVALKLIPETASEAEASPVVAEGRLLARVRHPNVLTVYGAERIDGRVGIWTELIDGETLAAEVSRRGPLTPKEAAEIGIDVCRALQAVHQAGLLHRDIKAQNILRDSRGRLVLGDFGTGIEVDDQAFVAEPRIAGTPLYLAPEVIVGEPTTIAADLYSVGVLLYFLVTADYPVRGRTLAEIRQQHAAGRSVPLDTQRPDVPKEFAAIVDTLLTRAPEGRYDSASTVAAALETFAVAAAGRAVTRRQTMRRRLSLAVAALLAIAAAIAGIAAWSARAPAVLPLNSGDWIVVADFENATGDEALDAIPFAFKRELEYSDFVRVAQASRIDDSLRLLHRPLDSRVDAGLARQVALQDGGIRAVVSGQVRKEGAMTVIAVDVVDPLDGATIGQLTERAADVTHITASIRRMAVALRERVGEPNDSITRSEQALQSTPPPPLTALRSYARAAAAAHSLSYLPGGGIPTWGPPWAVVERFARDAIEADQTLARAWVLLSDALDRQRLGRGDGSAIQRLSAERRALEEKAFQLIAHATPRERYAIEASLHGGKAFHHRIQGNLEAGRREMELSMAATQALLTVQPDGDEVSESALQGLNDLLGPQYGREITLMTIEAANARPKNVTLNLNVANSYLSQFNFDAARRYAGRAESAIAAASPLQANSIRLFGASAAWLQDDPREALRIVDRVAQTTVGLGAAERRDTDDARVEFQLVRWRLAELYFALGRSGRAAEIVNAAPAEFVATYGATRFFSHLSDLTRLQQVVSSWPDPAPTPESAYALQTRLELFIEMGKLEAAERDLVLLERIATNQGSLGYRSIYLDYLGALELARGRPDAAINLLKESAAIKRRRLPPLGSLPGQYTIDVLAEALEANGRLDDTIALLVEAGNTRGEVAVWGSLDSWMRQRAHLARLYRKTGQGREAEAVEAHLLKLLAVADPDFPLLRELRSRSR